MCPFQNHDGAVNNITGVNKYARAFKIQRKQAALLYDY